MLNKYSDDNCVKELRNVHKGKDVEIIAAVDFGGSWEWDEAKVYRVYGDGIYYVGSASGCSCDSYDYSVAYGDLMQFSSRRSLLAYLRNSNKTKIKSLHSMVLSQKG